MPVTVTIRGSVNRTYEFYTVPKKDSLAELNFRSYVDFRRFSVRLTNLINSTTISENKTIRLRSVLRNGRPTVVLD